MHAAFVTELSTCYMKVCDVCVCVSVNNKKNPGFCSDCRPQSVAVLIHKLHLSAYVVHAFFVFFLQHTAHSERFLYT